MRFRFLVAVCLLSCLELGCRKSAPHWVTLRWDPAATTAGASITSYNIYRSTTTGGPYAALASHVPGPPFEDHLVAGGRTYFYVVTAVDTSGRESGYSKEIRAAIP